MEPKPASMLDHLQPSEIKLSDINPSMKESSKVDESEPIQELN